MINNSRSEDRRDRTVKARTSLVREVPKSKSRFGRQVSRWDVLRDKVKTWVRDSFEVADALREIRDDKLYKDEYETFEQCCLDEFGLKHSQAYNLIAASKTKASLQTSTIVDKPLAENLTRPSQARALSAVKEAKRVNVLKRVVNSGEPVTAKSITEAIKPSERRKKPDPVVIDVTPEPKKKSSFVKHCPTCTCVE